MILAEVNNGVTLGMWDYRSFGLALLDSGESGRKILQAYINNPKDPRLAELAWRLLYLPMKTERVTQINQQEDNDAFHNKPVFVPTSYK